MTLPALSTATHLVNVPLLYKGKVRELYDLGEHVLIVVTDRISAFDYVLEPPVPAKGTVLNKLSAFWFEQTEQLIRNHVVHTDVNLLGDAVKDKDLLDGRIMVCRRAERIDIECVVRGYITGGGWRQYQSSGRSTAFSCRRACARTRLFRSRSSRRRPRTMSVMTRTSRFPA